MPLRQQDFTPYFLQALSSARGIVLRIPDASRREHAIKVIYRQMYHTRHKGRFKGRLIVVRGIDDPGEIWLLKREQPSEQEG